MWIHVIERVVYFTMLGLGIFFIYREDVMQRFWTSKTYLVSYDQIITELPTIMTWMFPVNASELRLGTHFNIKYILANGSLDFEGMENAGAALKIGENLVNNTKLKISLQEMPGVSNVFVITPLNFKPGMSMEYMLAYEFVKPSKTENNKVGFALSTRNNTHTCNVINNDGDVSRIYGAMGQMNVLSVTPVKVIRLPECRLRPYNELVNEPLPDKLKDNCYNLCKPKDYLHICESFQLNPAIRNLPTCQTTKDTKCFKDMFHETVKSIPKLPCTKVSYTIQNYPEKLQMKVFEEWGIKNSTNLVLFHMTFDEARIKVEEEYLVFDAVAMVSAIGGTMGLCIGLSFTGFASTILRYIAQVMINHQKGARMGTATDGQPGTMESKVQPFKDKTTYQLKDMQSQMAGYEMRLFALEKRVNPQKDRSESFTKYFMGPRYQSPECNTLAS